jgi:hypothetical protein
MKVNCCQLKGDSGGFRIFENKKFGSQSLSSPVCQQHKQKNMYAAVAF